MSKYSNSSTKHELFMAEKEKVRFQLEQFRRSLKFGYSDSNFSTLAYYFGKLSPHMPPGELEALGELWSRSYTSSITNSEVDQCVDNAINSLRW